MWITQPVDNKNESTCFLGVVMLLGEERYSRRSSNGLDIVAMRTLNTTMPSNLGWIWAVAKLGIKRKEGKCLKAEVGWSPPLKFL